MRKGGEYVCFRAQGNRAIAIVQDLLSENNVHEAYSLAHSCGKEQEVYEFLFGIPVNERHPTHLEVMMKCLHSYDWFHELPLPVVQEFCKVGTLHHFKAKDVVFREGDEAHSIYVIMEGTVDVMMEEEHRKRSARRRYQGSHSHYEIGQTSIELWRGQNRWDKDDSRSERLLSLGAGQIFGERAFLRNPSSSDAGQLKTIADGRFKTRGATIVCTSDVKVVRFDTEDFVSIVSNFSSDVFDHRFKFMRTVPTFKMWSNPDLCALTKLCQVKRAERGNTILEQGRMVSELSIIRRGICKVVMYIHQNKLNVSNRRTTTENALFEAYHKQKANVGEWVRSEAITSHRMITRALTKKDGNVFSSSKTDYRYHGSNSQYKEIGVAVLNSQDVFGEMALLDARGLSRVAIVAESQVDLLTLKRNDLMTFEVCVSAPFTKALKRSFVLRNPLEEAIIHHQIERRIFDSYKGKFLENSIHHKISVENSGHRNDFDLPKKKLKDKSISPSTGRSRHRSTLW